jgi:CDP-4-dehydro-6-deoxyglucose reductase, E1
MIKKQFVPGTTYVPVSGKVYDQEEIDNAKAAAEDEWWTEGRWAKKFEREFKKYLGVEYVSLVNSGSSANLNAVAALTSSKLKDRQLKPGDEFITCAAGFPTTVNPGIQHGLTPVFVDAELETFNIDIEKLEQAISPKTKLIMVAHTLGVPYNLDKIMELANKHKLWVIEDCCDALGSTYKGKLVGTFGDIATYSFYPAHQITMGEGGAVVTNNPLLHLSIRQFRDWGRDCWCDTGHDNTCGKRFKWKLGELPYGYDHKYIYSQIGYNLKLTDFGPAIGVAQLKKLPRFIKTRRANYAKLAQFFRQHPTLFSIIEAPKNTAPCWFGFPAIVAEDAPFTRNELTEYLEENLIGTRNVFSGNLLRHPAYLQVTNKRVVGEMDNADIIMNQAFWLGVFPGIEEQQMKYVLSTLEEFISHYL